MKKVMLIFTLLMAVAGVRAALPVADLIAQIHFAGAAKISAAPNAAAFTNEFSSVEAMALRAQTADKLAPWLAGWLQANTGAALPDGAAKLRPLLDDLQTAEWFLDARAVAGKPSGIFAIKLESAPRHRWRASLQSLPVEITEVQGWLFCLFGNTAGNLGALEPPKPSGAWLDLDVNWPRLAQWFPKLKELGLPETQFTVTAPDNNLRIDGKFFFPENLALKLEPWRVPTNTLHQPFVSFTAVRGLAAWLPTQPWALAYKILPTPNQLFVWALPLSPFQTFAAAPVPDAADALTQAYERLQPVLDLQNAAGTFFRPLTMNRTNDEIHFVGTPFIAPFLRAVREPAGQFLMAGVFPNTARSKPLPPQLFARLAQPNLVYYHWEITAARFGERFDELPQLTQLGLMLTQHRQLGSDSAALKWIRKSAPYFGNTVTEVFQTGPAEMTFTRTASGGLTAFEMLALGSWLEAPNFPGCNLKIQRPIRRPHAHPQIITPPPAH